MSENESSTGVWRVWVDTGGTFTDGLAVDPAGGLHRAKVLSSSALRGRVGAVLDDRTVRLSAPWRLPDGFAAGAELRRLERGGPGLQIAASSAGGRLTLAEALPGDLEAGEPLEIRFDDEAPVLAARLLTATPAGVAPQGSERNGALPPMALRLATTRGTNALLERRGARCALLITRGFADLLAIGNQQRADLFALDARKPPPLYEAVIEVPERLDAAGEVVEELDLEALRPRLEQLAAEGFEAAAVALLHSYRNPAHERLVARELERAGVGFVATSAELAPVIKILPRAETAVVDAYLGPIIEGYLRRVEAKLDRGRLLVMTSAGGLMGSGRYRARDSLLSGPAGGVVGAAGAGRDCGFERLIAFDMGGTSTDVSRFDGDYEYVFEHAVGGATVSGPALAIETVAAGGGSICHREGRQLTVGPESAGADPGPACYGAGGPLTLTDVNLLLGRLDPARFGIPIQPAAAEGAAVALLGDLEAEGGREHLLEGFLAIADERMAEAIRRISVRRGYDPRRYALVAFGGAGGQHACAVAGLLGMSTVVAPADAGLLSAAGLGAAVIERFTQLQVLSPLSATSHPHPSGVTDGELEARLAELAEQAVGEVVAEGVGRGDAGVRRRLAYLRFAGQEATLELEVDPDGRVAGTPLAAAFLERYRALYGYRPAARPIEVDSLRVVASSRPAASAAAAAAAAGERPPERAAPAAGERRAFFAGDWQRVPVYHGPDLLPGHRLTGPALVLDDHATLVVGAGWRARMTPSRALVVEREK